MLKEKFQFLSSVRFWKLVGIALTTVLMSEQIISTEIGQAIIVLLGGSIAIRTVDRIGDRLGNK